MPVASKLMSIAELKYQRRKTISVNLGDDEFPLEIDITYSPDAYTRQLIEAANEDENKIEGTYRLVSAMLVGWGLEDELNAESLDDVGFLIQSKILVAITKDINGGDETDPKEPPDDSNGG